MRIMSDPNYHFRTGFMFFSNLTRHEITKDHPELRVGAVAKILGLLNSYLLLFSLLYLYSFNGGEICQIVITTIVITMSNISPDFKTCITIN